MNTVDKLRELGTSTWLDDLSRDRIASGNLEAVKREKSIVGVTTNPAIFASAMSSGSAYDEQIQQLKASGASADEAVYAMSIDDVRDACDIFQDVFDATGGVDGRVSIEVDPRFAYDEAKTIAQAKELWARVGKPNAMIKVPATDASLPAVTAALAAGISVNVTLIFSVERYRHVIRAYKEGIRLAADNGHDVSKIHSVASFFVSRMDTEVDARLDEIGTPAALALRGKAGVANAQLAYRLFLDEFASLEDLPAGANVQRPLWASTGVKNPEYPATLYVSELAGPHTVNTMPEGTIDATLASDSLHGDTLSSSGDDAESIFNAVAATGVDLTDVVRVLEQEGVDKFVDAWQELLNSMSEKLQ